MPSIPNFFAKLLLFLIYANMLFRKQKKGEALPHPKCLHIGIIIFSIQQIYINKSGKFFQIDLLAA